MMKISKNIFIILVLSFVVCQDYSLMNIYWEPESPNKGNDMTIYADVSSAEFFKYSHQMNIHLSIDGKKYSTYAMSKDYNQGLFTWAYQYKINQNIYFQIDNNYGFNDIDTHLIKISDYGNPLEEAHILLGKQDYQGCILALKNVINNYQGKVIAAKAEYMIAEILLNDFEEYSLAANYYKNIISSYPYNYQEVKKSMFTLSYIYANYLGYYSDAIAVYRKFQEIYPSDPLLPSIDYELEILSSVNKGIEDLLNSSK